MEIYNDFSTTVEKALSEIDPKWREYRGMIVCGTHTPDPHQAEFLIDLIKEAREWQMPFLGICFGHQIAAIEYARNILGDKEATSEEWGLGHYVVKKLPSLKVGQFEGESYWNNYEVNYGLVPNFEKDKPDYFITCQYHPEYQSSKDKPHLLLVKFLDICKK